MSFLRSPDQVAGGAYVGNTILFNPAEVLSILYESKMENIKRNLPPPLEPYEKPYVIIAYNNFKDVNFDRGLIGPGYRETALYIPAYHKGQLGTYVAAMTLNTDMGTLLGRELMGYPKKVGTVDHYYKGDRYVAFSARHGIPYATMEGILDGTPNDPAFLEELGKINASFPDRPGFGINWTFNWAPCADKLFAFGPLLVEGIKSKHDIGIPARVGKGNVQLIWSDDDPWADFEVVRVLGAVLSTVESRLYSEAKTYPVDPEAFKPYAFFGWDLRPHSDFEK